MKPINEIVAKHLKVDVDELNELFGKDKKKAAEIQAREKAANADLDKLEKEYEPKMKAAWGQEQQLGPDEMNKLQAEYDKKKEGILKKHGFDPKQATDKKEISKSQATDRDGKLKKGYGVAFGKYYKK